MELANEKINVKAGKYSKKQIDAIRATFENAPAVENFYTAKDAVAMLAKPIAAMRDKGYSVEDIAAKMRDMGIDLSPSTLVSALRFKKTVRKLPKKAASTSAGKTQVDHVEKDFELSGNAELEKADSIK